MRNSRTSARLSMSSTLCQPAFLRESLPVPLSRMTLKPEKGWSPWESQAATSPGPCYDTAKAGRARGAAAGSTSSIQIGAEEHGELVEWAEADPIIEINVASPRNQDEFLRLRSRLVCALAELTGLRLNETNLALDHTSVWALLLTGCRDPESQVHDQIRHDAKELAVATADLAHRGGLQDHKAYRTSLRSLPYSTTRGFGDFHWQDRTPHVLVPLSSTIQGTEAEGAGRYSARSCADLTVDSQTVKLVPQPPPGPRFSSDLLSHPHPGGLSTRLPAHARPKGGDFAARLTRQCRRPHRWERSSSTIR